MLLPLLLAAAIGAGPTDKPAPKVYVILWFDTEDYLLPASDDAALWVAEHLSKQGIKGTFKIVGEKARTLEKRKRDDVIAALKKHEIGYHTDYHSTHPTPAQYLDSLGWDEGVTEFDRREGQGWRDVERIFGQKPTCYGQPGRSWGPQAYGALAKWGMIYLDGGKHISVDGRPCYFAGVFNLYHLTHTMKADLNKPDELDKANERFAAARKALLAEGGGIVSVVYHPCEWVHKKFWDGVNFAKGENPPREKWVKPPQKTDDETKLSRRIFADYIAFMRRFKDVEFITASQAAKLYPDRALTRRFTRADIGRVARKVADGVTYQVHGNVALSAAEVFALLSGYVATRADSITLGGTVLGPTSRVAEMKGPVKTDASQFVRTNADVVGYLTKHRRVPGTVWLGSQAVPPEAYLKAQAKVALRLLDGKKVPDEITVEPTKLEATKHVAADDAEDLWKWPIFPPGFRASGVMELARRQSWTIKPALLAR